MSLERLLHVRLARLRVAREQRLRSYDHAIAAIAALTGLFMDERTLQHARLLRRTQALDRGDAALADRADGMHARPSFNPVDQHAARAALCLAAAEFGAAQLEVVAQDIKQRRIGLGFDGAGRAVNLQCE